MNLETKPIAETPNFIVLDQYEKIEQSGSYQSENQLEAELVADLQNQGYEYRQGFEQPKQAAGKPARAVAAAERCGVFRRRMGAFFDGVSGQVV